MSITEMRTIASLLMAERPATLNDREWEILTLVVGQGATLTHAGRQFGITPERVRQIIGRSYAKMRGHWGRWRRDLALNG